MSAAALTAGVLICSYKRPDSLARCFEGLLAQTRRPDDVMVVCRQTDQATRDFLANRAPDALPIRMLTVVPPGTVRALNTGLDACRTDVLAIVDDDTVASPEWLATIVGHFAADPSVGGVGGRDRNWHGDHFDDRQAADVGRVQWFGRQIGNHHIGFGSPRPVGNLKGANMAYRARAFANVRFDLRLRGQGAQPYEDLTFSQAVRRAGWKLIYDPAALVLHYPGQRDDARFYSGVQKVLDVAGYRDCAYNTTIALWDEMSPLRRVVFLIWSLLIGTGVAPGLVQAVRYTPALGWRSWQRFWITQQGKAQAVLMLLRDRSPRAGVAASAATPTPAGKLPEMAGDA